METVSGELFPRRMRDDAIQAALETEDGKIALGQAMAMAIQASLKLRSNLRMVLHEQEVPSIPLPIAWRAKRVHVDLSYLGWNDNGSPALGPDPFEINLQFSTSMSLASVRQHPFYTIDRAQVWIAEDIIHAEDGLLGLVLDVLPVRLADRGEAEKWVDIHSPMRDLERETGCVLSQDQPLLERFGFQRLVRLSRTAEIGTIGDVPVYDVGLPGMVILPPRKRTGRLYHDDTPRVLVETIGDDIVITAEEHLVVAVFAAASTVAIP